MSPPQRFSTSLWLFTSEATYSVDGIRAFLPPTGVLYSGNSTNVFS